MNKREVRQRSKERIAALSEKEKIACGKEIAARLFASEEYRKAASIFLYLSTTDEADTHLVLSHALSEGKTLYLPRIEGKDMALVPYREGDPLAVNRYGISEPTGAGAEVTPDLAVIPLVAFDRTKTRLGRGKGYYDRFLSSFRGTSIALAFSAQEWDLLPAEPFDRKPSVILTEKERIE